MVSLVVMQDPVHPSAPMANGTIVGSSLTKEQVEEATFGVANGQILPNGMPPQQVYVNPASQQNNMTGLEDQLRNMGMVDPVEPQQEVNDGQDADLEDDGDNDEETNDEDPLKLFVGQVRLSIDL